MKISQKALPWVRTVILLVFVAASLGIYGYFWTSVGGKLPPFTSEPYTVVFQSPYNLNLVAESQVTKNGVPVGRVTDVTVKDGIAEIQANFRDHPEYAPLHQGASAAIKAKTLINETYIDITDGTGPELPTGTVLPPGNVKTPVDVDDVLRALPTADRQQLGGAIQSLSAATNNNQSGISQVFGSLGKPTQYVPAALEALSKQEQALRQLTGNTAGVLDALDTRRGQIAQLVSDADRVTQATAGSSQDLSAVIQKLPPTLVTAQNASDDLTRLGAALQPVANNLNASAGPLSTALTQLPGTASDLRGLLPYLDQTLVKAPPTLQRVPTTSNNLVQFIPGAGGALDQLQPTLNEAAKGGTSITGSPAGILAFFTNIGAAFSGRATGQDLPVVRVAPVFGADSVQSNLVDLPQGLLPGLNNPMPGQATSGPGVYSLAPLAGNSTTPQTQQQTTGGGASSLLPRLGG